MYLSLKIEREISQAELALLLPLIKLLKPSDGFSLQSSEQEIQGAVNRQKEAEQPPSPLPAPVIIKAEIPSSAVKHGRGKGVPWRDRLEQAFADIEEYRLGKFKEHVQFLKELDWTKVHKEDWVPYTTQELGELLVLPRGDAEIMIRRFLQTLRRCPLRNSAGYFLPPTVDMSAAIEKAVREQTAARNVAQTGDSHLGLPYDVRKEVVNALARLDFESPKRNAMRYSDLAKWLGIREPGAMSTHMVIAMCLRNEYGYIPEKLEYPHRGCYKFPLPRTGVETYPGFSVREN